MNISSKRAEYVALTALALSIVFFVVVWVAGALSNSFAVSALSWQILGGALVWLVLVVLFHQRSLAEQEKLDMAQLSRSEHGDTIFQGGGEQAELFAVAGKRLIILEKWFVPIFGVLIAVYQIMIGVYLFHKASVPVDTELKHPQLIAVFMIFVAFVGFLISRYATGMSTQEKWKPLRAGASSFVGTAILAFCLAVSLSLAQFKINVGINVFVWVIPVLIVILGIEISLNSVLDIYRPRIAGQYSRSAFDSRLLGLFSEPGGIFHTFASTIDYQFGFKVSHTWFYKLLEKAIIPLVVFSIVTLYLLSCVVIVDVGEQAIIEHFGSYSDSNGGRSVGPGLHWKLPWPFDVAYSYPTRRVQEINIGFVEETEQDGEKKKANKPLLWGEKHYEEEYDLIVASEAQGGGDEKGSVPISIVRAAVPVQYTIKDLKSFLYNHADSEEILEAICYRELVRYAASAKIETGDDGDGETNGRSSLLGSGRKEAAEELTARIQASADMMDLGVEIVFLGLQGVHPPPEVAEDYQKVIGAVQGRQAEILNALAERNNILASLTGSVQQSNELYALAREYRQAKEEDNAGRVSEVREKLDEAYLNAKGEIFKILSEADSYAFERAKNAEADGNRFHDQILAYEASPEIYKRQQRLSMLEEALVNTRKYVIIANENDSQVFIIDLKEKLAPDLYDLGLETPK